MRIASAAYIGTRIGTHKWKTLKDVDKIRQDGLPAHPLGYVLCLAYGTETSDVNKDLTFKAKDQDKD